MPDQSSLEGFRKSLAEKGKQKATIESYQRDARALLDYLQRYSIPLNQVDATIAGHFVRHLTEDKNERINSVRRSIIGIRQYFRFLTEAGTLMTNPLERLPIPSRDEHIQKPLTLTEVQNLLDKTRDASPALKGFRDAVIICLLAFEGVKVSELTALRWVDFLVSDNLGSLRITGQRGRVILLHRETTSRIQRFQEEFLLYPVREERRPDFKNMILAFNGRDLLTPSPAISRHGLKFLLHELAKATGRKKLSSEMLRHFAIRHHLQDGKSTEEIMQHFGLRRPGNINRHLAAILRTEKRSDS